MTIQWFPGHMAKARRQIEEKLKLIDIVIELLDARIPLSSRNPMIDDIVGHKRRLVVLNKVDLADPGTTEEWIHYFDASGLSAIPIDSSSGRNVPMILSRSKQILLDKIEAQIRKRLTPRPIRALIVGIPNVGKSTLINRLAGRNAAKTGDRPGVTKGQQWIKVGKEMELLDTPGILWPKFDDPLVGLRLAATGAIKEEILNVEDVAFYTLKELIAHYGDAVKQRYGLEYAQPDLDNPQEIVGIMETIGRKRGCLQGGGTVDLEKTSLVILRDLRSGKFGRVSLERPVAAAVEQ